MNMYDATELAFKHGYEVGLSDAVKHGKWIADSWNGSICSCCNNKYIGYLVDTWNYCPNCGARMDLED